MDAMTRYKPSSRHRERDRKKPGRTLYLKLRVNHIPGTTTTVEREEPLTDIQASLAKMRERRGLPALKRPVEYVTERRGVTRQEMITRLLEGIEEQDYWLPSGWDIDLLWRNKKDEPWREAPYPVAMAESAENGRGFDVAVARYLESQRYRRA